MNGRALDAVIARILGVYRGWGRGTSVLKMRADWDTLYAAAPADAEVIPVSADGVPAAWIVAPGADRGSAIVYLHGGGFRVGSIVSHRALMANISHVSGCAVLGVEYRLVPEHCFPAPLEDAIKATEWALATVGNPARVAIAGDSAGGGLALSTLLALRDGGGPLPAAAVLLSPWTDLAATGDSFTTRADSDPIHQRGMILTMAKAYLGDIDPHTPLASPLYADLTSLPPMLIQVGDRETVLDDARLLAEKARAAGVPVTLEVEDGMIHVFQMFAGELPEADAAILRIGAFIRSHLGGRG